MNKLTSPQWFNSKSYIGLNVLFLTESGCVLVHHTVPDKGLKIHYDKLVTLKFFASSYADHVPIETKLNDIIVKYIIRRYLLPRQTLFFQFIILSL